MSKFPTDKYKQLPFLVECKSSRADGAVMTTIAQQMMIDDGAPPSVVLMTQAERNALWRGRKLTRQGSAFKSASTKAEEAATKQLRKEIAAAEEAKKQARFDRLRELRERTR